MSFAWGPDDLPTAEDLRTVIQQPGYWLFIVVAIVVFGLALWASWEYLWPTSRIVRAPLDDLQAIQHEPRPFGDKAAKGCRPSFTHDHEMRQQR